MIGLGLGDAIGINAGLSHSITSGALRTASLTIARSRRSSGERTITVNPGRDRQRAIERLFCPFPPQVECVRLGHSSLFSLRRPQCVSLRSGLNSLMT
jgi:hypothetical protein